MSCVNNPAPYARQQAFNKLVSEGTIRDNAIIVVRVVVVEATAVVDVALVVRVSAIGRTQPPVVG